jgi:hypothetical protein
LAQSDDLHAGPEHPDDERGRHNRLGYLDVDEDDSSSERGTEEPDVEEDVKGSAADGERSERDV